MAFIRLKNDWLAPTKVYHPDGLRTFSGQHYKKGEHEIPDALVEKLPKSAVVLEGPVEVDAEVQKEEVLKDYDNHRHALDAEAEIVNEHSFDPDVPVESTTTIAHYSKKENAIVPKLPLKKRPKKDE